MAEQFHLFVRELEQGELRESLAAWWKAWAHRSRGENAQCGKRGGRAGPCLENGQWARSRRPWQRCAHSGSLTQSARSRAGPLSGFPLRRSLGRAGGAWNGAGSKANLLALARA